MCNNSVVAITPKRLALDLLRVAPAARPVPVKAFLDIGGLFGLQGNAVRVALARLLAAGMVESDERGWYRLGAGAVAVNRLVEEWRLGEARMRPWDGGWWAVSLPRGGERAARRASVRALERVGLREGLDGLWVRPDNLASGRAELAERLRELGLASGARLFRAHDFDGELVAAWWTTLWDARAVEREHDRCLRAIERSAGRVERKPRPQALVESFVVGGDAIRSLARDPLLPDEAVDGATRRALTEAMTEYDRIGRGIWRELLSRRAVA